MFIKQKMHLEEFQIAIIKLQHSNGFFRFGSKLSVEGVTSKQLFLSNQYTRWPQKKSKEISLIDLKLFIISCLYPKNYLIYFDFGVQSKVFHAMFNFSAKSNDMERKDELSSYHKELKVIEKKIQHYFTERGWDCGKFFSKINETHKRMLIFIGFEKEFKERMKFIYNQIVSFNNGLVNVNNVEFSDFFNPPEVNGFQQHKLWVSFRYADVSLKMQFQIYFTTPQNVKKKNFQNLVGKKNNISNPRKNYTFIWMETPKVIKNQCFVQIEPIYDFLSDKHLKWLPPNAK